MTFLPFLFLGLRFGNLLPGPGSADYVGLSREYLVPTNMVIMVMAIHHQAYGSAGELFCNNLQFSGCFGGHKRVEDKSSIPQIYYTGIANSSTELIILNGSPNTRTKRLNSKILNGFGSLPLAQTGLDEKKYENQQK